jgi:hypothetical protein
MLSKKTKLISVTIVKKTFKAEDIEFRDPATNINIITPPAPFVYVDKIGVVTGGGKQPSKQLGDKVLCCPHCHHVHLFGLDMV